MSRIVEPSSVGTQAQQQQQQAQQQGSPARSKMVQRLLDASASLPNFLNDLLTTQAVVVAGTEAAVFMIEKKGEETNLRPLHHIRPDDSDAQTRTAALQAFQGIILPCVEQNKDGAIEVGGGDGDAQFCLVTLLRNEGEVVGAAAVVTRCRDIERAKQRLTSMQLVAGYFELFSLKRYTEQARLMAERHQQVLQYTGAVATAEGFEAAAMNLCNEMATRTGATRVSLGWVKGKGIKVKALSHTEKFDKKQELVVHLQKVMEECLDQEEPVKYDPVGGSSANVTRSAADLSRKQGGNIFFSIPLRRRDEIIGVVTLEFPPGKSVDAQTEEGAAVGAELLAPQLFDRYENDRYIVTKMALSAKWLSQAAIGPRHMGIKLIILAIVSVGLFVGLYKPMYRVGAPMVIQAAEKRIITAPFDGTLDEIYVKKGKWVEMGTVLAKLRTTEYELKKKEFESKVKSALTEADRARNERKMAEVRIFEHAAKEAQSQVDILDYYIREAEIKAPFDGVVIAGDWFDRKGAPARTGEPLFEVAATAPGTRNMLLEAQLHVSERDIQEVSRIHDLGRELDGELATTSFPDKGVKFAITRLVPAGQPKEGENVFHLYAAVQDPPEWMTPGHAGEARIDIEERTVFWMWTHRLVDWMKLKFWM